MEFEINQAEVLRYLGYRNQNIDEAMGNLLTECLAEIKAVMRTGFVYNIYNLERQKNQIKLISTNLVFSSKALSKHLQYADKCALMAATLGVETDQKIAYYSRLNLTKGIVMDACATAAIEALCDKVEAEIGTKAKKQGYTITNRYSPGYGDLPIMHQKAILGALQAYPRIGLTVTENSIMLPRKSVTAFIGLRKKGAPGENGIAKNNCRKCLDQNCPFRKGGELDEEKA